MEQYFAAYIKDMSPSWSPATARSERMRLRVATRLGASNPEALFEALKNEGRSLYGIKTLFIRLGQVEKWANSKGYNVGSAYADFHSKYKYVFARAYQRKVVEVSYDEAVARLRSLPKSIQVQAFSMIHTGLRISEMYKAKDGLVTGKGGKTRKVPANGRGDAALGARAVVD